MVYFQLMISKRTFTIFALLANVVMMSTAQVAFAMTADEEIKLGRSIAVTQGAGLPVEVVGATSHGGPVRLEMQFLVDVSGSVDPTEFVLQRTGYSDAFRDAALVSKILGCGEGSIAAQLVYWSGGGEQAIGVDWTEIDSPAAATAFADAIDLAARPYSGLTAPGSAINFGVPLFASNSFTSARQVIDVSGDGVENDGADTSTARDAALAAGIEVINGIVIGGVPGVLAFYTSEVIGGSGAFVLSATTFDDFGKAIKDKIATEICPGGESLNINTTSLLVSGLYANAIWMIPTLAGLAGTGIYFLRARTHNEEI